MNILTMDIKDLRGKQFDFRTDMVIPDCRVDIYDLPRERHNYGLGFDAAYGLPGRDWDAITVFCKEYFPYRQVAEVQGHFGTKLPWVVFALARWFNDAFICGERQVGLWALRMLWDEFRYRWMYYDRNHVSAANVKSENLGHHRSKDDILFGNFRNAVHEREVVLVSKALREQARALLYREPAQRDPYDERRPDDMLQMKLTGGGSPDLVMGGVYGYCAVKEMGHYPRPAFQYAKGTLGDILGHNEVFHGKDAAGANQALNKRTFARSKDRKR